jgi:hypothetical protein
LGADSLQNLCLSTAGELGYGNTATIGDVELPSAVGAISLFRDCSFEPGRHSGVAALSSIMAGSALLTWRAPQSERLALTRSGLGQACAQIRQGDHENHRVEWRGIEAKLSIKCGGALGQGVNEETAYTDHIGGVNDTPRRVLKDRPADSPTMMRLRYRQARKDNDRDRIRHVTSKTARRCRNRDGARRERVVSDHRVGVAGDERT